jgi:hypothetical protein
MSEPGSTRRRVVRQPQWFTAVRRRADSYVDRAWVRTAGRIGASPAIEPFDGDVRFGLVTVNASTTHYLKLMLCTLAEQSNLGLVHRIVVVDNRSRDGGVGFVRALAAAADDVHLVENRTFLNHARGIRAGLRELERCERDVPVGERANVLLFVDSDVIFRSPTALTDLAATIVGFDAALVGEVRKSKDGLHPNIQASFLALRRDVAERPDIDPWISSGGPTFDLQWSVVRAGLAVIDFPSNAGGHILHRGRSASEAASRYSPLRSYGTTPFEAAHFMGVPDGARIWAEVEARHASLLTGEAEPELVASLARSFARLGSPADRLQ